MRPRMKQEDFIIKSKTIHGGLYNYSKVKYIGNKDKVIIICKEHGDFEQTPNNHLYGQGCYKCKNNLQKSNLKIFIEKSIESHGYRYDYSKSEYKNTRTDITIICKRHDNNTIYEFNGDYWHGNPMIYKKYDRNKNNNQTFGELYDKTIKKSIELKEMGYNIISIWENEYLKEKSIS